MFILVRLDFVPLALALVLLSKWRMFAVRPRFWAANLRANGVDLVVGFSAVLFMAHSPALLWQVAWAAAYAIWLLAIKPSSTQFMIAFQAFISQLMGLSALYTAWDNGPVYGLTLLSGLICFISARHFLESFEEPYARMLSYFWAYFGAALAWLTSHWLLFYSSLAQPTLLLSVLGYGLAGIYYLDHTNRLNVGLRRQFIFIMTAVILVVLVFSDWGDKVV
jgi:hypothetical protein